jgi:hypothetical protein
MEKLLTGLFVTMLAGSVFADNVTGTVVNLVQDDEGINIILQNAEGQKAITTHYLNNQSSHFIQSYDLLNEAKDRKQPIVIELSQSDKTKVVNVKIKK